MDMKDELQKIQKEFAGDLKKVSDHASLESLEQKYFARKSGEFSKLMKGLGDLSDAKRKELGKELNALKTELERMLSGKKEELQKQELGKIAETEAIDVTQPSLSQRERGHLHPIAQIQYELEDLFASMGFLIADGPELESEYYNFESVNIPKDHPARDSQDTFYIKKQETRNKKQMSAESARLLMRTHTSNMQVRAMREYGAPLRVAAPGRCFRNEATDARHEHTFYQLEGFMIDREISFSHMKGVLEAVAKHLYGEGTQVQLRPKYYPFVEPGVNGEVTCFLCSGKGCRVCKHTGWLEIFGAGMIHPNVLREGNINPNEYQGFAFGFGLNRLVMLKYGIEDIRLLQSGDLRFLEQF